MMSATPAIPVSLTELLLAPRPAAQVVALRAEPWRALTWAEFSAAVAALADVLGRRNERRWALFHSDGYAFAVGLFALLHSGKSVLLPANAQPGTVRELAGNVDALLGEFGETAALPQLAIDERAAGRAAPLQPLDARTALELMTSGSTGGAKIIRKTLAQLAAELQCQELRWGAELGAATVLATVSHQHIYGLLFRVLWPLCSGRPFAAHTYSYPEPLFKDAASLERALLVSSPAHLKRLPPNLDSSAAGGRVVAVFSSGGPLPSEAARAWNEIFGHGPIEIFGSTETGGVGYRVQAQDARWKALPGVALKLTEHDTLAVCSPFTGDEWIAMGDRARLLPESSFELLGRADRIVKVEEKRVSLDELDARLREHAWVADARTVPLPGARTLLGAALELNAAGREQLQRCGRRALGNALREHLLQFFERVLLPRKWRYVAQLPGNSQGKIARDQLLALFEPAPELPGAVLWQSAAEQCIAIDLAPDDAAFAGHFPSLPVLPGVMQLDWAIRHSQRLWYAQSAFSGIDQLKFQEVIAPGAQLQLRLVDRGGGIVEFAYGSGGQHDFSSGRLRFGAGDGA